jgi:hypothetical protein
LHAYQNIDTAIRLQFQKSKQMAPSTGAIMSIIDESTQPQSPLVTLPNRNNKKIIGISTIAALAIVLLIAVLFAVQPHATKSTPPSSKSTQVTTNAQAATITFTRVTAPLQVPGIVTVASDGSGQIAAKQESATLANPVKSAPIDIPSLIEFPITVTNTSSSPVTSPISSYPGSEIISTNGRQGCGVGGIEGIVVQVNPGQTVTQPCLVNSFKTQADEGFATYDDTSHPPLVYTGTNRGVNYTVPAHCGDTSQVVAQAQNNLESQLSVQMTKDKSTPFGSPNFALKATCNPPAGNVQYDPTASAPTPTYVQMVTGSVTQSSYNLNDVIQFQTQQLQNAAKAMQGHYTLLNPQVCSGIMGINYESSTKVTLSCPATGTAAWNWDDTARNMLAASLAGNSEQDALAILNSTQGIVPGSVQINLPPGASLPTDASAITFAITP